MPEVNRQQFWKANPNQMALPGMEEHAHPGAKVLAQGYRFVRGRNRENSVRVLKLNKGHDTVSGLAWGDDEGSHGMYDDPHRKGEIVMVHTDDAHRRQGLASTTYAVARQMARVKPQHSDERTPEGNAWAHAVTKKHGGRKPSRDYYY